MSNSHTPVAISPELKFALGIAMQGYHYAMAQPTPEDQMELLKQYRLTRGLCNFLNFWHAYQYNTPSFQVGDEFETLRKKVDPACKTYIALTPDKWWDKYRVRVLESSERVLIDACIKPRIKLIEDILALERPQTLQDIVSPAPVVKIQLSPGVLDAMRTVTQWLHHAMYECNISNLYTFLSIKGLQEGMCLAIKDTWGTAISEEFSALLMAKQFTSSDSSGTLFLGGKSISFGIIDPARQEFTDYTALNERLLLRYNVVTQLLEEHDRKGYIEIHAVEAPQTKQEPEARQQLIISTTTLARMQWMRSWLTNALEQPADKLYDYLRRNHLTDGLCLCAEQHWGRKAREELGAILTTLRYIGGSGQLSNYIGHQAIANFVDNFRGIIKNEEKLRSALAHRRAVLNEILDTHNRLGYVNVPYETAVHNAPGVSGAIDPSGAGSAV